MSTASLLLSLYQCKAWANRELFAQIDKIDPHTQEKERHAVIRLMNHIYVVDQIFAAHLQGKAHSFTGVNTPETPELATLQAGVSELDAWFLQLISELDGEHGSDALAEKISFTFTDGLAGCMSREEMLLHVAMHGSYHRGGVGKMLMQLPLTPPRELYTAFLHQQDPSRRLKSSH